MEDLKLQRLVKEKLEGAMPGARVHLRDLTGEGNHLEAAVIWPGFEGMTPVQQHRRVYAALEGLVGGDAPVHALSLKTWARAPEGMEEGFPPGPER